MNHTAIFRVLSLSGFLLGLAMVVPLGVALILGESQQVLAFGLSALLTLVIASMVYLLIGKSDRNARVNDALTAAVLWCFGAPIPAALPFVIGTAEPTFIAAFHEAVSCLTTTGHSVIDLDGNAWPVSLLVWRGVLHFIGMIFSLTLAATIFAALGFAGPGIHRSYLFTLPEGDFFDAIPRAFRTIFIICGSLTLFIFSVLILNGADPFTALSLGISVSSTGLVDPNGYAGFTGGSIVFIGLFVGLLLSTAGLPLLMNLRPRNLLRAEIDPELYLLIGLIFTLAGLAIYGGMSLFPAFGWALSSLSTSGIPMGIPIDELRSSLPLSLLILPALIGGAALSTAGGIKLARIIILIRRAGQEFARLGFHNSVVALKFKDRHQKESAVLGVWVYLIAYIAAISALFVVLSFLDLDFASAIAQSVGAVSNSGWLIDVQQNASSFYHATLSLGMILGRLEILALIPVLNFAFWRR